MYRYLACALPLALAADVATYERLAADGDVTFSRTFSEVAAGWSGTLEFAEGCADEDDYGSNNCAWSWGDALEISGSVAAGADVAAGSTIVIDAKVDSIVRAAASIIFGPNVRRRPPPPDPPRPPTRETRLAAP